MQNMPWAKLENADADHPDRRWLSLVDHSADVAAVFEAILRVPTIVRRLAALASSSNFPTLWVPRLSAHVALHDFGKTNRGFQARRDPKAPPARTAGHVLPGLALIYAQDAPDLSTCLTRTLPMEAMVGWGESEAAFETALRAVAAHHGRPISQNDIEHRERNRLRALWAPGPDYDPIAALAPLSTAIRDDWFPEAFAPGGEPLPEAPRFWHAVAGLVMLADWIGSNQTEFPLYLEPPRDPTERMSRARAVSPGLLADYGFDPAPKRSRLPAVSFGSISEHPPRPIQEAVGAAEGRIVILEAETGSGKTEAALWRFARLFEQGEVDGLYFALPTRVAANSLYERVHKAVARMFPADRGPAVILAVPGYARVDGVAGKPLPGFEVLWDDDPDDGAKRERWAAEHPKRFLAGMIAVGTIDQALLGAIQVRHAHMRSASLLRHLLVVDEVHASDVYMERLLTSLLDQHTAAGGHALLLSATLGAASRLRLLGRPTSDLPDLNAAVVLPYPAISTSADAAPRRHTGASREKEVKLEIDTRIQDPGAIARLALDAAELGAKVLVVRNLRRAAVATAEVLLAIDPDHLALFRCKGIPTLHHGRFAREDRELLDSVIDTQMKAERGSKGLVLVGTQTLEQSLDICADLLITDLAPADVLLQRIGRLHRHDNPRPRGFETPRVALLSPPDLTPLLSKAEFGMGGDHGPYRDLVMLEATRRLATGTPVWRIPEMNRLLVESSTHPEALEALCAILAKENDGWRKHRQNLDGGRLGDVYLAQFARLKWEARFTDEAFAFPKDEKLGTRLGVDDLQVQLPAGTIGPFGTEISALSIPAYWLKGADLTQDPTPSVDRADTGLVITVLGLPFRYDRLGLHRA